jgi:hypothetical protein
MANAGAAVSTSVVCKDSRVRITHWSESEVTKICGVLNSTGSEQNPTAGFADFMMNRDGRPHT